MREIGVSLMIALAVLASPPVLADKFNGEGMDVSGHHSRGKVGPGGPTTGSSGYNHPIPEAVTRNYHATSDTEMSPEQYVSMYSRAIDQYTKMGNQYQLKQQWDLAEKAFRYVIQVSAMRDGPGSPKMVSTLQHLVSVTEAQKKYLDAIGFQQRIVAFAKNGTDPGPILSSQILLAKLFMKQQDLGGAADTMQEAFDLTQTLPKMDPERRRLVARTYGEILRASGKNVQANRMEMQAEDKIAANKPGVVTKSSPSKSSDPISDSIANPIASPGSASSTSAETHTPVSSQATSLGSPATSSMAPSSATKN